MEPHRMRAVSMVVVGTAFALGVIAGWMFTDTRAAQPEPADRVDTDSSSQLRTTLYFGTARPKGSVSELEWQLFLREEVSSRFPEGLTVWDADGQWRTPGGSIAHERTKVLLLVHPDTSDARDAVRAIIAQYCRTFEQQSVLWETARVFVAS